MIEAKHDKAVPLKSSHRLWLGPADQQNSIRMFRKTFNVTVAQQAVLNLFADSRYQVWVNGSFVARGPAAFHPHRLPIASYDVTDLLQTGENVIAALVLSYGAALHMYVPSGRPGLVACLSLQQTDGEEILIQTDSTWKATAQTGWNPDAPRRSWAIGAVENYDANEAPDGWQNIAFDDSNWSQADDHGPLTEQNVILQQVNLPNLSYAWKPARTVLGHWATTSSVHQISANDHERDYGQALIAEKWTEPQTRLSGTLNADGGGLSLSGLQPEEGAVICLDLGKEYCGHVSFTIETESKGVIDCGWSERLEEGRPWLCQKGSSYVDRFVAKVGTQTWQPIQFNAGRYLSLAFRGFSGSIELKRIGMLASEPDLEWRASFTCSDETLNSIWRLCARSLRVGTQEIMMDCPTREQALYLGDGIHTGLWIGRLTGDYSHYQYLLREGFAVQGEEGLVRSTVFSGRNGTLLDYPLLAIWSTRIYLQETGDTSFVRELIPAFHKLLDWYLRQCDNRGIFAHDWETSEQTSEWVEAPATAFDVTKNLSMNVFIDHPGLGWHNPGEPGIDRRGTNAAMNALFTMTMQAFADVLESCGEDDPATWRERAETLTRVACEAFWSEPGQAFVDGIRQGEQLTQISQQTNTWCLSAGFAESERAQRVLDLILDPSQTEIARCGPYFWAYLLPALTMHGRIPQALAMVRELWGSMLARGATTLFETFAGDDNDSCCHPWSGAPVDFLLRHIAGIGSCSQQTNTIELRPRPDLVQAARACLPVPGGLVTFEWDEAGIRVSLPTGRKGMLTLPDGSTHTIKENWQHTFKEDRTMLTSDTGVPRS